MFRKIAVLCAFWVLTTDSVHAAEVPLGPELPLIPLDYPYDREQRQARAAGNSGHFMVVWTDANSKGIDGLLDGRIMTIVPPSSDSYSIPRTLTAGSRNFLLTWSDGQRLLLSRIGFDGALLDQMPIVVHTDGFADVGVAYNGSAFAIVWTDSTLHSESIMDVGAVSMGSDVMAAPSGRGPGGLDVVWTGSEFLVPYVVPRVLAIDPIHRFPSSLGALLLDPDAIAVGRPIYPIFDEVGTASVSAARLGGTVTMAWGDVGAFETGIAVAQLTTTGEVISARRLLSIGSEPYVNFTKVRIIGDANEYVLVWFEVSVFQGVAPHLRAIRLSPNANPIDPAPFDISESVVVDAVDSFDPVDTATGTVIVYSGRYASERKSRVFTRTLGHLDAPPPRRRSARP